MAGSTAVASVKGLLSSGSSGQPPGAALPGERRVEADECNFWGLGAAASEGAEMLVGLGAVALGGRRGAGG